LNRTPSLNVAGAALSDGAPEFALRIAQQQIAANGNDAEAWVKQGDSYAAMGNPFQAAGSYRHALSLRSRLADAQMGLGRLALQQNPAEAIGWFQKVLAVHKDDTAALNDLGIAQDLAGQHIAAQASYRQALAIRPDLNAAQVNLGLSLAVSGHARDGVLLIQPLAQGSGATARLREDLAVALLLDGREAQARDVLRQDVPADKLDDSLRALQRLRIAGTGAAVP